MPDRSEFPIPDETLDTLGLYCPVPVWETAKRIKDMRPGQVIEVLSDDEGIMDDMPTWCRRTGQEYLGLYPEGPVLHVFVKRAASPGCPESV